LIAFQTGLRPIGFEQTNTIRQRHNGAAFLNSILEPLSPETTVFAIIIRMRYNSNNLKLWQTPK
jgi:hypothetical protein